MKWHNLFSIWLLASGSAAAQISTEFSTVLETSEVQRRQIDDIRRFDGIVEAVDRATVSAQTSGRIISLGFDVDDFVSAGEIIVQFSDTEHRARLDQAKSNLQAAIATRKGAEEEFKRVERLLASGTVARARFDSAKATFEAAQAQQDTANAAVEQSQEQLGYTVVRAPYSGLVIARHVQIGEIASPGQPLMTGFSLDKLRVSVAVPQQYALPIRQSGAAIITDDTDEIIRSSGLTVFPFADEKSNTVTVRIGLPEGTSTIFPGMLVKAVFKVGVTETLTIPRSALVRRSEVVAVYLVSARNELRLQQIRIGRSDIDGDVEVLSGLNAGDRIASDSTLATQMMQSLSNTNQ